jgi:hypothetical protein
MAESEAIGATLDPPNKTLLRQRAVLFFIALSLQTIRQSLQP